MYYFIEAALIKKKAFREWECIDYERTSQRGLNERLNAVVNSIIFQEFARKQISHQFGEAKQFYPTFSCYKLNYAVLKFDGDVGLSSQPSLLLIAMGKRTGQSKDAPLERVIASTSGSYYIQYFVKQVLEKNRM